MTDKAFRNLKKKLLFGLALLPSAPAQNEVVNKSVPEDVLPEPKPGLEKKQIKYDKHACKIFTILRQGDLSFRNLRT